MKGITIVLFVLIVFDIFLFGYIIPQQNEITKEFQIKSQTCENECRELNLSKYVFNSTDSCQCINITYLSPKKNE
jgi:hypothetical protein